MAKSRSGSNGKRAPGARNKAGQAEGRAGRGSAKGSPAPKGNEKTKRGKGVPAAESVWAADGSGSSAKPYVHSDTTHFLRPDVGTQATFKKKKDPKTYRYDSSLSPSMEFDGQNPAREQGEWLIGLIERGAKGSAGVFPATLKNARGEGVLTVRSLEEAIERMKGLSKAFLNWAGKAERQSFQVPTLPLFVHERLSTKVILESVKGHAKDRTVKTGGVGQMSFADMFGAPETPVTDQMLRAYEYPDKWTNRMILGDSLVVMNSLLEYERLGGQVQMIYMDPPYGVKFGSNFQPFVRKRDVDHNDDEDMTREPEMVQAYRDTWELGLHSYLTYLRDRLLTAHALLAPSGSIFVQISDENLHHVRELLDDVFGVNSFLSLITFSKTSGSTTATLPTTSDYLLWYARDPSRLKFRKLYLRKYPGEDGALEYKRVELPDGELVPISKFRVEGRTILPSGAKIFATDSIVSKGGDDPDIEVKWKGKSFTLSCKPARHWKAGVDGTKKLWELGRLLRQTGLRIYKRYLDDFPYSEINHVWTDTRGEDDPSYVVQTHTSVLQRCILMTTEPGDLVLDPTCGSGTTAYVAEEWGRRWITIDTSRVPLALARQRLLTATFPYYELQDESRGPSSGFVYKRKQNRKGEEIGGIVPHITLKSIANNEPADEEVLVDRPEKEDPSKVVRITGPFTVEATIPTPASMEDESNDAAGDASSAGSGAGSGAEPIGSFTDRMLEVLRRSPLLHVGGNRTVTLKNVRKPAKTLSLSAEAGVEGDKAVALVFGPENGAISDKLVYEAAREAVAKNYAHLYVIGFAIQPQARKSVEEADAALGIPATYIQATPDLMMGDLLKTMRSSQIFSVCGLPDVELRKLAPAEKGGPARYEAHLRGLDTFDPATMKPESVRGNDVPCWMLDTDYNGLCFRARQVFFPRTAAWDDLRKSLKADFAETVWEHLAGDTSTPFELGEHEMIAVKVIDDRGNELMVVKAKKEAV